MDAVPAAGLIKRRTILAAGAAGAGLSIPGVAAYAGHRPSGAVRFTLNAEVLDGGEQVTSITLDTSRLGQLRRSTLTTDTFSVHAKATSPIPIENGDQIFSEYDLDRAVTGIRVDRRGDIVLDLAYGEGEIGGGTLGYILSRQRNVVLDLEYTITQNEPITVGRRSVLIEKFRQGRLSDPEVDAFAHRVSASGMKYRLYSPRRHRERGWNSGRRPLVVWLHGGGEGASLPDGYYDNETTLRANRGALGFAAPQAQRIFGGAYVVAPQSTSYWIENGPGFAPQIKQIIREVQSRYPVDARRIYVAGCSNGGYMSMELTVRYPDLFAASAPVCGVIESLEDGGPRLITDAELRGISTPTWLVTSSDDDTVPPRENTVRAHELIPKSLLTLYDDVTWNGYRFPGHWSWIYLARNDPKIAGTSIWQWMARQERSRH